MRKGFIFNYELCVACKACSAACMLENGWNFKSRTIYSSNSECFRPDPVITLSMACNHCVDPVCLKGCPSGAYSKDNVSGAVIIDPGKCLGCRYCIWNCPYDAPKFNDESGVIEKCHFCYHRLAESAEPACSSSCPTGALSFGDIPETISLENYSWIPEKDLNPSLLITGKDKYYGPAIIPERPYSGNTHQKPEVRKNGRVGKEWSLTGFTFLAILSVAVSASAPFSELQINRFVEITFVVIAALMSLFHLSSGFKAWRAIINIRSSALSREIAVFLVYAGLVIADKLTKLPFSEVLISIAGISLVFMIDSVYNYSLRKGALRLHSGQAFVTVMLMISFLMDAVAPFVFIAFLKVVLSFSTMLNEERKEMYVFRFIRLAFLFITAMVLVRGTDERAVTTYMIFFSGELADRIIFYADFRPLNMKNALL
jgi:Fe-S-cluster-containing dehydrogenase component/DMSO reductase anchor subunit